MRNSRPRTHVNQNPWVPRISEIQLENILGMVAGKLTDIQTSLAAHGKLGFNDPLAVVLLVPSSSEPYFSNIANIRIGSCSNERVRTARINAEIHHRLGKPRYEAAVAELASKEASLTSGASAKIANKAVAIIIGVDCPASDQIAHGIAALAARSCFVAITAALRK
ncbi:MAG TPA: hypothetical protein VFZ58_01005 [Candidatus Saccharimonadales bacterium]